MLALNNAKQSHNARLKWKPRQDYSENGSIIYPRQSLQLFRGKKIEKQSLIDKVFHEGSQRENKVVMFETVIQYPFKKHDIIIDSLENEYLVVDKDYIENEEQGRYMKANKLSKTWYLLTETNE